MLSIWNRRSVDYILLVLPHLSAVIVDLFTNFNLLILFTSLAFFFDAFDEIPDSDQFVELIFHISLLQLKVALDFNTAFHLLIQKLYILLDDVFSLLCFRHTVLLKVVDSAEKGVA